MIAVLKRPRSVVEAAETTTVQFILNRPYGIGIFCLEIRLPLFLDAATKSTIRDNMG